MNFCKSFRNFHHFKGFSYTTKYLLQNHFYIALNSFEVQIHWNYHSRWLECRKFKKTNQEGQRPGTRSVCHLPNRQGGLNDTVNEFALMNDLVTHYQLLNFVNLWVTEWNKKDSTSQECSCFIVLVTLAVSYLQWFFLGVRTSKHEKNKSSNFLSHVYDLWIGVKGWLKEWLQRKRKQN